MEEEMKKKAMENAKIMVSSPDGTKRELKNGEIIEMLQKSQEEINRLNKYIKDNEITVTVNQSDGTSVVLKNRDVLKLVDSQQHRISELELKLSTLTAKLESQTESTETQESDVEENVIIDSNVTDNSVTEENDTSS